MSKLDKVEEVDIDAEGRMKYILIEVEDATGKMKTIVRGYKWADYHGELENQASAVSLQNCKNHDDVINIIIP